MRTIKFRGYSIALDEFVYGYLEYDKQDKTYSIDSYVVYINTIGQFTGMYDKNGTEIYEGDILVHDNGDYSLIVYREECMAFCRVDAKDVGNINGYFNLREDAWRLCLQRAKVIGNQYVVINHKTTKFESNSQNLSNSSTIKRKDL